MAGMFHEMVEVFNRTTGTSRERELTVTFDGQRATIPVGKSMIPKITLAYAKNQNVVMGSEDAIDPMDYQSLIAVVGKDDCTPIEEDSTQLSRVKLKDIVGDDVEILVRGKKQPRAFDAAVHIPGEDGIHVNH